MIQKWLMQKQKTEEFDELHNPINDDLSCLKTYCDDNRLSVNVDKCELMLLGTYQALQNFPALKFTSIMNPSDK